MKLYTKIIVLILILSSSAFSEFSTKLSVKLGAYYDSNMPQNITENSSIFFVPGFNFSIKNSEIPLKFTTTMLYENYIEDRSPYLNDPFFKSTLYYLYKNNLHKNQH